jgi:hypothetical protein
MKCPNCGYHSQPKPRASAKTHKYAVCYANHDEHCYCVDCAPMRGVVREARLSEDEAVRLLTDVIAQTAFADAPDLSDQLQRLQECACGHDAHHHRKDELENLLQCDGCSCTHFHYQRREAIAA